MGISPVPLGLYGDETITVWEAHFEPAYQLHDYTAHTKCATAPTLTSKTTRRQHPMPYVMSGSAAMSAVTNPTHLREHTMVAD